MYKFLSCGIPRGYFRQRDIYDDTAYCSIIKSNLTQILLLSHLQQVVVCQLLNVDVLGEQGQSFTDQEIKDESLTFVLIGCEAAGNLMVWILSVLMTNKSVLQVCREEVDRILPKNENLSELIVCEAVIN